MNSSNINTYSSGEQRRGNDEYDTLSVQRMLPYLLLDISKKVFIYDSLESTNKAANDMIASGAEHGTVIIANSQTAGKGRYGRVFHSPPVNGLYMSLILHPSRFNYSTPTLITASAVVSVCETIEAVTSKAPQIKWVNDILLNRKKICGILTEATGSAQNRESQWLIVGIGINVRTPEADFPEELREIAGSIFDADEPAVTRNQLAAEIVNRIALNENQYKEKEMLEEYKQRMDMLGKTVLVTEAAKTYEAVAMDIDEKGRLLIKKGNNEITILTTGEIRVQSLR